MILELGDGRELKLPDEMEDEHARQLKGFILATEERAVKAEERADLLRTEMVGLREEMKALRVPQPAVTQSDEGAVIRHAELLAALDRVEKAVSSERELIPNDFGDGAYSRLKR